MIWGKNKPCTKNWGNRVFNDLLTNKIFSKQILFWDFKMELSLKRGLVRELFG